MESREPSWLLPLRQKASRFGIEVKAWSGGVTFSATDGEVLGKWHESGTWDIALSLGKPHGIARGSRDDALLVIGKMLADRKDRMVCQCGHNIDHAKLAEILGSEPLCMTCNLPLV